MIPKKKRSTFYRELQNITGSFKKLEEITEFYTCDEILSCAFREYGPLSSKVKFRKSDEVALFSSTQNFLKRIIGG